MKNALWLILAAVLGIGFGLFVNEQAHRYSEWLYLVHYGETPDAGVMPVTRFFAKPIYAAWGFFGALYAVVPTRGDIRKVSASLGVYFLSVTLGFGMSLGVHPLFHRLGTRLSEEAALKTYIGLDVFVCPLLTFLFAIFAVRLFRRYVIRSS